MTRNRVLQENARSLRQDMSLAEQRLWYHLRDKRLNGIKFRRQQVIGRYIVDFVCMQHRLVIELDGGQHAEQMKYDAQRTAFLHRQGYRVLRFWNDEVLQQTESVLEKILECCCDGECPHPSPPPQAGEGTGGSSG
ncbi:very-short-patch-repair endonuclease [Neisseria sp. HSC-16F19]|nr:very-short-patch-repair endonuclease [Neisseria sp. HSC-16F19]